MKSEQEIGKIVLNNMTGMDKDSGISYLALILIKLLYILLVQDFISDKSLEYLLQWRK